MWQILSHPPKTMCCSPLATPVNNSSLDLLNIWIQTSEAIPKTSSEIIVPHSHVKHHQLCNDWMDFNQFSSLKSIIIAIIIWIHLKEPYVKLS